METNNTFCILTGGERREIFQEVHIFQLHILVNVELWISFIYNFRPPVSLKALIAIYKETTNNHIKKLPSS